MIGGTDHTCTHRHHMPSTNTEHDNYDQNNNEYSNKRGGDVRKKGGAFNEKVGYERENTHKGTPRR